MKGGAGMATKLKGIDISQYQGKPDFSKVKNEVDFVILKAGYGRYTKQVDPTFEYNYQQCKKYNIPVGAYWFGYAMTPEDALREAQACHQIIKGHKFEFPIYYDVEEAMLKNSKSNIIAEIKEFCRYLESNKWYTGIYMSRSPAQQFLDSTVTDRYALWLAEYGKTLNWGGSVGMWQYSSSGKIQGISGNVDRNECYIDYPSVIKKGGFNGYTASSGTKKTLDTTGFKKGDKILGVLAYKEMLMLAKQAGIITQGVDENDVFGEGTEKATNQVLAAGGYAQNGIAGTETIKFLSKILKGSV